MYHAQNPLTQVAVTPCFILSLIAICSVQKMALLYEITLVCDSLNIYKKILTQSTNF